MTDPLGEAETLDVRPIVLAWSAWHQWNVLLRDARSRGGVPIPHKPGVYEVRTVSEPSGERLTIGRAASLRFRIKQLLKPTGLHSTGWRLRPQEDPVQLLVRWAETDRPGCAEEFLHQRYLERFGQLPKYVKAI